MRRAIFLVLVLAAVGLGVYIAASGGGRVVEVSVFADRTLQGPVEELVGGFTRVVEGEGVVVRPVYVYGSSGFVLAQLELRGGGDLYVSDGAEFAYKGLEEGVIDPEFFEVVGCVRLSLLVAEGNPLGLEGLEDVLSREGVRLAVGNPEHVTAGVLAWRVFEEAGLEGVVEELAGEGRIVFADSAAQAAFYVVQGVADAAITFKVFEVLNPGDLDEVYDPVVAGVSAPVIVALPVERGPLAERLFEYVVENREVFGRYGVEVDGDC